LKDCQALGLVEQFKVGQGHSDKWNLREEWRETFAEMLAGDTTHVNAASDQPTAYADVEAI